MLAALALLAAFAVLAALAVQGPCMDRSRNSSRRAPPYHQLAARLREGTAVSTSMRGLRAKASLAHS